MLNFFQNAGPSARIEIHNKTCNFSGLSSENSIFLDIKKKSSKWLRYGPKNVKLTKRFFLFNSP